LDRAHEPAVPRWPRGWRLLFLIAAAMICWVGLIAFGGVVAHWLAG
jgi:hypothetical protein